MSVSNLTPALLNHIYSDDLYTISDLPQTPSPTIATGGVVVVYTHTQANLPPDLHTLLSKVLQAVGLAIETVHLLNLAHSPYRQFIHICKHYQPQKLISFGVTAGKLQMAIHLKGYSPTTFYNVQLLLVHDLATISTDKHKKLLLWRSLKVLFDMS